MDKHKFQGKYRIESTRLTDYDYSRNGAYFVTICTKNGFMIRDSIGEGGCKNKTCKGNGI